MLKVAIQGRAGSFSHIAASKLWQNYELIECQWFDQTFAAVLDGKADIAVLPIENSIAGTIHQTYDLINKHPELKVVGEHYLRVEHNLVGEQGMDLKDVTKIYSHPMAIRQCNSFLKKQAWQVIEHEDTAGSVEMVCNQQLGNSAAIASSLAAEIYGGQILQANIEDDANNYTRFWVIGNGKAQRVLPQERNKMSLVFETKHEPGALAKVLNIFASANVNMTKLESRPVVGKPWEYLFYCDVMSDKGEEYIRQVLEMVETNTDYLRVLGAYKATLIQ